MCVCACVRMCGVSVSMCARTCVLVHVCGACEKTSVCVCGGSLCVCGGDLCVCVGGSLCVCGGEILPHFLSPFPLLPVSPSQQQADELLQRGR